MTLQENTMMKSSIILLLLLLLASYFFIYHKDTPQQLINLPLVQNCNLNEQSCQVSLPDGTSLSLSILPQPIPLAKPLDIKVKIQGGVIPESLSIDFEGKDMNMGLTHYELKSISDNLFQVEGMLGICIRGKMLWKATLMINTKSKQYKLPFEFVTMNKY